MRPDCGALCYNNTCRYASTCLMRVDKERQVQRVTTKSLPLKVS